MKNVGCFGKSIYFMPYMIKLLLTRTRTERGTKDLEERRFRKVYTRYIQKFDQKIIFND